MKRSPLRLVLAFCVIAILCALTLHLVAGTLCLSARAVSGCQSCCQSDTSSETQGQGSACGLLCCVGLPVPLKLLSLPTPSFVLSLPGLSVLSMRLPPPLPPPRFSPSAPG